MFTSISLLLSIGSTPNNDEQDRISAPLYSLLKTAGYKKLFIFTHYRNSIIMHLHGDVTVKQLFQNDVISRRTLTACARAKLFTLSDIVDYYTEHDNFLAIKRSGMNVNSELISLCRKWETEGIKEDNVITGKKGDWQGQEEKDREQRDGEITETAVWERAEKQYRKLKDKLPRLARNRLLAFCNGDTLHSLLDTLNEENIRKVQQVLNPKLSSGKELRNFLYQVNEILPDIPSSKKIRYIPANSLCLKLSFLVPCNPSDEMGIFMEKHISELTTDHFPLLAFAHVFIQNCIYYQNKQKQVFLRLAGWYASGKKYNLAAIAQEFGYAGENSIRHIMCVSKTDEKLLHLLEKVIAILQSFGLQVPVSFILQKEDYYLRRFDDLVVQTPFTTSFAVRFMAILNPDYEVMSVGKDKKEQPLLLAKRIIEQFGVHSFLDAVDKLLKTKRDKDQTVPFAPFAAPFIKQDVAAEEYEHLVTLAASLMYDFYGISPNVSGSLYLKRTTTKKTWEYVYEVLKEKNKSCSTHELVALLAQKGKETDSQRVISSIHTNIEYFYVVSKGIYGLKDWKESGKDQCKDIKELIVKYLNEQDEPKHIFDIFRWVMKYRSTVLLSIQSRMQEDPSHRFLYFGSGFYGLADRKYNVSGFKSFGGSGYPYIKRLFAREGKDRLQTKAIIDIVCRKYKVKPVQVEFAINRQIAAGIFKEEEKYLVLLPK